MPQKKPSRKLPWRQKLGYRSHLRNRHIKYKLSATKIRRIKIDSQENKEFLELIDITKSKEKNK